MGFEPPDYTDEEILADWEIKAAHWENEARNSSPDIPASLDKSTHVSQHLTISCQIAWPALSP